KATVDALSSVDPLTGTFMSNLNADAIDEIDIVTTGAGAEYGGAVGGFGQIITKQGGRPRAKPEAAVPALTATTPRDQIIAPATPEARRSWLRQDSKAV